MPDNEANSFDDFLSRFDALLNEAQSYGIHGVVILREYDPINDNTTVQFGYKGGKDLAVGLMEHTKDRILHPEEETD